MHFRNHQEYLKFFRQAPIEPHEYEEPVTVTDGEEGEEDGEVLQAD